MREKTLNKIIIGLAIAILLLALLFLVSVVLEGRSSQQSVSTSAQAPTEDTSKTVTETGDSEEESDKVTDNDSEEASGKLQTEQTEATTEKIEYNKNDDYVLPYSASKYYTKSELSGLTKNQLAIARNEIYAKHGYIFQKNKTMKNYFESKDWYQGNNSSMSSVESEFNKYEKKNIELIQSLEK